MTYRPARNATQHAAYLLNERVNRDQVRVGDAERDAAASALGDHFALGRLTRAEYDERLAAAFAATLGEDLRVLFRDLPQPHGGYRRPEPVRRPSALGAGRPRGRRPFYLPFLPVLILAIGVAIATGAGWVPWVALGVLLWGGKLARWRNHAGRARHHGGSRLVA
jgi:hypothetical protein